MQFGHFFLPWYQHRIPFHRWLIEYILDNSSVFPPNLQHFRALFANLWKDWIGAHYFTLFDKLHFSFPFLENKIASTKTERWECYSKARYICSNSCPRKSSQHSLRPLKFSKAYRIPPASVRYWDFYYQAKPIPSILIWLLDQARTLY